MNFGTNGPQTLPSRPHREECHLYLVSTGIGDPDNITVRAQHVIRDADVILGMPSLLEKFSDLLRGKEQYDPGHGLFTLWGRRDRSDSEIDVMEDRIRQIVRSAVKAGKKVAIIDYGDSMIFGPQAGYLKDFIDLNPTVIPGVSAFNAGNAALAIDIMTGKTSRSATLAAAFDAAEEYTGTDKLELLTQTRSTLVFFTMRSKCASLVERLQKHLPSETPIAIVYHAGWTNKQSVLRATLGTVLGRIEQTEIPFEHLVYVGDFLT